MGSRDPWVTLICVFAGFLFMRRLPTLLVGLLLGFSLGVSSAASHSLLTPGDNESLVSATLVADAAKSWAVYAELHEGGEAQYYRFEMNQGQRLHVMLFISPASREKGFNPSLAIMGPGIESQGTTPSYVDPPSGSAVMVLERVLPAKAEYEPFSPSSFYPTAEARLDVSQTGTYYLAVYEESQGGNYGIAIGDLEAFTVGEVLLLPISLIGVYEWEGQSLEFILSPVLVTFAIGIGVYAWRSRGVRPKTPTGPVAYLAGLFFAGSGALVATQMVLALTHAPFVSGVGITAGFVLLHLGLGLASLRIAGDVDRGIGTQKRLVLALLGFIGLFLWAGLLLGPALAVVASLLPRPKAPAET